MTEITEEFSGNNGLQFVIDGHKQDLIKLVYLDETIEKLDTIQSKVNQMVADRYLSKMENVDKARVESMKRNIDLTIETVEDIKTLQSKWIYLENILNSGDMKKLREGDFMVIDNAWKNFLNQVRPNPKVYDNIIKGGNNKLEIKKNRFIEKLDIVLAKIEDQLRNLKMIFYRFYFLGNEDILYMLSNCNQGGSDIDKIKPYLSKIFEDVSDVELNENNQITKIISPSKEELVLKFPCKVTETLEIWLGQLEESIRSTVIQKMKDGYDKMSLEQSEERGEDFTYVETSLSQVVATVEHVNFCEQTEDYISKMEDEPGSLIYWITEFDKKLKALSKKVNNTDVNNPNYRRIICNLITHYVHNAQILDYLVANDVDNIADFSWNQQLRAYYIDRTVHVYQMMSQNEYGYEYIGPCSRIVISSLTDKVWMTMTNALHIRLGCSLGGPAGTGKTETTKDLARFFGIQCIVFNCSEQIDYKTLGNIFSGCCSAKYGAYACLDEFNRINIEVLSVVAQQLLQIRLALLDYKKNEPREVTVLVDRITLYDKLGIFVTMNPTYSGRTELPDNLKSLFRPITMMVPDFMLISKVRLRSEGFEYSDDLAVKMTQLYKLASEQLSQQNHYDFTLRTVGTVLSIAGKIKKASASKRASLDEEKKILIRALMDANLPKFTAGDILLFNALIQDLFPNVDKKKAELPEFEMMCERLIGEKKLTSNPFTLQKCLQINDIVNIRLGICVVGPASTGKSTNIKLVEEAWTKLNKSGVKGFNSVEVSHLNPKAITMGEMYGEENEDTKTFIPGIATEKITEAIECTEVNAQRWVVFDGPIDTLWIENMNSVLDDSMLLCLPDGSRIKLKAHVKIFFEVEDLLHASLATVSRLGIVFNGKDSLDYSCLFKSWMKKFFVDEKILNKEMQKYLYSIFEDKVPDAFENLNDLKDCVAIFPVKNQCIISLTRLLEMYLTEENGFIEQTFDEESDLEEIAFIKRVDI